MLLSHMHVTNIEYLRDVLLTLKVKSVHLVLQKTISDDTSNHHPDNVISNIFIRAQVRETFLGSNNIIRDEAQISKMYEPIRLKLENSYHI